MSRGKSWPTVAGLCLAVLAALLLEGLFFPYLVDDSFISYRYAENLAGGRGLVFNPGERVEGYSNFLWVIILAALGAAGAPVILASKVLGILCSIGSIFFVFLLSKRFSEEKGFFVLTAVLLTATDIGFVRWSVAGLETQLAVFLFLTAATLFAGESNTGPRFPLSGFFFGLLSLTRPEAPLVFAAALVYRICGRRKNWSAADTTWVISYAAVFLPFLVFRYSYYGMLLPNSYYAKTGGGLKRIILGIRYANQFFASNGGYLLLPLISVPFILRRFRFSPLYPLLLAYLLFIVYVGGDHMDDYRFFMPVLPVVFLLGQEGLKEMSLLLRRWRRPVLVLAVAGLALSNLAQDYYQTAVLWWGDVRGQVRLIKAGSLDPGEIYGRAKVGMWLAENVPSEMVVAVEDCGMIPYYSGLETIDMFGLMDAHLARVKGMMHRKFDASYVLDRKPDLVILIRYPGWLGDEPFWQSEVDRILVSSNRFHREYRILHRIESEERWFLIYERRP